MYTEYPEINNILEKYKQLVLELLGDEVVSIFLTGSLTYGDFVLGRSDIDLHTITKSKISSSLISRIDILHQQIESLYPEWENRIEASYTPVYLFNEIMPPKEPRPWYGFGKLYKEADYGNEWIINNYILQEYGVLLYGKKANEFIPKIQISDVKDACKRDFYKEWLPKIDKDIASLDDNHMQSYVVLNICRILYTLYTDKIGSKTTSSEWVKTKLLPQYKNLIEKAQNWKYGDVMGEKDSVIQFISKAKQLIESKD